ncbi:MAG: hypothetical protein KF830_05415 [Planctomycetes bacterium]|nr:hypothetical protein [Planctomycetota bacterium]
MKRVLLFLLLLAIGAGGLWLAIGGESPLGRRAESSAPPAPRPRGAGGLPLQQGKIGVSVSQTGPLSFPQYRTVPLPDGTARHERVFLLEAEDSAPLDESRQQLDRVTVLLYEQDRPTGRLTAQRAFLELNRDAAGRPSLREDKDIDLREAVFETLPGAQLEGLRLELGEARIRIGEDELLLRTPNDDDPVRLVLTGERSGTLRGRGLEARLPRNRASARRLAEVAILHAPVLETEGVVVRADGRLDYREELDRGEATVTLAHGVQLDLTRGARFQGLGAAPPRDGDGATARIRGEHFTGWMQRRGSSRNPGEKKDDGARQESGWQRLLLTGAPASVEFDDGRLLAPRVRVEPGSLGDPWLLTAHGGESRLEQTHIRPGSRQTDRVTGGSPDRIHLVHVGGGTGAMHRALGFPQWTLRPLTDLRVVVFEGDSRLESGARTLHASRGLHVFHRDRSPTVIARGFGQVHIEQRATTPGEQDLVAIGDDGFELRATETAQQLRLGPAAAADAADPEAPWRRHRYQLQHGATTVNGLGSCQLERDGQRTQLWLLAPGAEIAGRLADQRLELDQVHRLEAVLEGEELRALTADGLPARLRRDGRGDTLAAAAPRLLQIGPRSLQLQRVPADGGDGAWAVLAEVDSLPVLRRTQTAAGRATTTILRGPRIDVHHLGGRDVLVDAAAEHDLLPVLEAELATPTGGEPTRAHALARRVRLLPFAISREAQQLHAGGSAGVLATVAFAAAGAPWLIVDDVRQFHLDDPRHGVVEGTGARLYLSQGAQAGLFVGDPDLGAPAEVRHRHGARDLVATGARVRLVREKDKELRLQALRTFADRPVFLLPTVTLHQTGSTALLSHVRALSSGNIDVLPDKVLFGGPVTAQGLRPDGDLDPEGIHLDARELRLLRDVRTGEVVQANGKDVRIDWTRLQAQGAEVDFDVRRNRCVVRDPADAIVDLPGGRRVTAPRIDLNYETMAVSYRNGRMVQTANAGADRR